MCLQLTFILKCLLGSGSILFRATHSYSECPFRLMLFKQRCVPVAINLLFLYQQTVGIGLPSASHDKVIFSCSTVFITTRLPSLFSINLGGTSFKKICLDSQLQHSQVKSSDFNLLPPIFKYISFFNPLSSRQL